MLRLDHNRALSQVAAKTGKPVADIEKLCVWGNHSPSMYADYRFATIGGKGVKDMINDPAWNADTFLPTVGKRGAAIIAARGVSSAASAANAAIDHMHDWALGTNGQVGHDGHPSDGQYGIPKDVMFGFPVTCDAGEDKAGRGPADRRLQPGAHQADARRTPRRAGRRQTPALKTPR
jgi:malate dehydrogenase